MTTSTSCGRHQEPLLHRTGPGPIRPDPQVPLKHSDTDKAPEPANQVRTIKTGQNLLLVVGEADVVGGDGVQKEPVEAGQEAVHLKHTHTETTCWARGRGHKGQGAGPVVTMEKGWLLASSLMLVNGDSRMSASGGLPVQTGRRRHRESVCVSLCGAECVCVQLCVSGYVCVSHLAQTAVSPGSLRL